MQVLAEYTNQINKLCFETGVKSLYAFGSVTTDRFTPESDIDLVVEIDDPDPVSYANRYFQLKFQLEILLKRHIDLLESKAVKNPYLRQEIENTKVRVYG